MSKLSHLNKVEFVSDFVEGDIVKFEVKSNAGQKVLEYSKIIKVRARIDNERTLLISYITENGRHVERSQIVELIRKGSV